MTTVFIISLLLLLCGGILCFKGIKIYKLCQMLLCASVGGFLGLILVNAFEKQELYILVLILTVIGAFLGYKYYKYSLYVCASLGAFAVTFSYFWKKAVEVTKDTIGEMIGAKDTIVNNLTNIKSLQNALDALDNIMKINTEKWTDVFQNAGDIIKHGIFISIAVALVVGILTIWIADYVIMLVTAAFGSMILVNMIELYIIPSSKIHLLLLVIIGMIGFIYQAGKCRSK